MLVITRAGVKDHGIVTELLIFQSGASGWRPDEDRDKWDRVLAELLNSDGWLFLLGRLDGEAVGLIAANWTLTLGSSHEKASVQALVVDRCHRKQGFGTELVEAMLASARRRGCREVEARFSPSDVELSSFFKSFEDTTHWSSVSWP